ncbi:hypothetical protein M5K25_009471 [Dendrobium thyrsiflorum]|uniref:Uncharacterized protein n=1 Tax=Dendrobium thyrsiflorum TaxID=117978 RepID=A0ABD0V5V8_DENTH
MSGLMLLWNPLQSVQLQIQHLQLFLGFHPPAVFSFLRNLEQEFAMIISLRSVYSEYIFSLDCSSFCSFLHFFFPVLKLLEVCSFIEGTFIDEYWPLKEKYNIKCCRDEDAQVDVRLYS